jgi:CBS domain-containing protein
MPTKLDILKNTAPFALLPEDVLQELAESLEELRYKKETLIYQQGLSKVRTIDIILDGGYQTFFYDSEYAKIMPEFYGPNTSYGGLSILMNKRRSIKTVFAQKGTKVYTLPRKDFKDLCQAYEPFYHYFTTLFGQKILNDTYAHYISSKADTENNFLVADQMFSSKVEMLEMRDIVKVPYTLPIYLAAQKMASEKVSCLFITDASGFNIIGYITDIILRDEVIAKMFDPAQPVVAIMASPILSINADSFVYEAILLMFQTKTRYVLVEKSGQFLGFLSRNKLLSDLAQTPFMFIQAVKLAQSNQELKRRWQMLPDIVYQLLNRGVRADIVNQVITTVADTIALKVIESVLAKKGPAPAKFVFMVLGSEGRAEQTLQTDQDNAIIYEDKANEQRELVREYFLDFAEQVSDALDYIGLSFCTGGYMAKNPLWTHSLSHWKRNYRSWMSESNPETVMQFSTFFDVRFIYGESALFDELQEFVKSELQGSLDFFLFRMANNALQYEPPLTLFGNIRTFTQGDQQVFDLKKAMTPIVDLVRVFALKNLIFQTNTGKRMQKLAEMEVFTEPEFNELQHAYYYLMALRLKKQARQMIEDKAAPTNYLDPSVLTQVERVAIKAIFKIISQFQMKIKVTFTQTL